MYCTYQDREDLDNDLYQEDAEDSERSEANSELEFHLYSQLHYSSNAGELEQQEQQENSGERAEVTEKTADVNGGQEHTEESRPSSPNMIELRQHQKKKQEKSDKSKKRKSNSKVQKSSQPVFEEVIVIDSSPDVISISEDDTADEDVGVCALKGRELHKLQTSTPAQQGNQKRKNGLNVPMTVDSSSSESDSEESDSKSESSEASDSSDSDGLESWMILGAEQQDGDYSISLNLEGGSDSSADVEDDSNWLVSDKDKEAQIYNKDKGARIAVQRTPNRYYTGKSVQCRNCNKMGHLSKSCPEPKKLSPCFLCGTPGHLVSECPKRHCNNCGLPGHLYESCSERAYWQKQCHRCNMKGHFFDACPEIWRQYHITTKTGAPERNLHLPQRENQGRTPAYCYNCSKKGHFGHDCTRQRMFNGTYPTTPFINHYDTVKDINRRHHRTMMKVKELKTNGFLAAGPQTPVTPGPPRKKQKVSNHKNNHQSNHTPHQSPSNHKPSPSHIFFHDSYDFGAPAPKTKKSKQETTGSAKPWKPKRPVPTSRDTPARLILDEAEDFPRGGAKGGSAGKKKQWKKKNKQGCVGGMQGSVQEKGEKKRKKKKNRVQRIADKKAETQMYPTDENLFIIKQRKRSR